VSRQPGFPGDRRALAKALTQVENGEFAGLEDLTARSDSWLIGITGPPGAGKSTLTSALVTELRKSGKRVAVLAVDPSSPFSGGALLGDRIRMRSHRDDPDVFIRSMSARGHLGGLSVATADAARLLAAAGFDYVIAETVGVGQSEIEVASVADVTLLVLAPGMGDAVQAVKAGVMEIADIFVVNKADSDGAGRLVSDIRSMLRSGVGNEGAWAPSVVRTVAPEGTGVADLRELVERHRRHLNESGELGRRQRARAVFRVRQAAEDLADRAVSQWLAGSQAEVESIVGPVLTGGLTSRQAAERVLSAMVASGELRAPAAQTTNPGSHAEQ
jgi:LAO/AO transport system kinase